jgi:hypothetical protein
MRDFVTLPKTDRRAALMLSPQLEGGRRWLQDGSFRFERTPHNVRCAEALGIAAPEAHRATPESLMWESAVGSPTKMPFCAPTAYFSGSSGVVKLRDHAHQRMAHEKFCHLKAPNGAFVSALFADMGTGKTKMAIDLINNHHCAGRVDAVILLAKKGVHEQWATDTVEDDGTTEPCPIKMFTQSDIAWRAHVWDGKQLPNHMLKRDGELKWFCVNFDAIIHKKAAHEVNEFMQSHKGRIAFVGDETHHLKNPNASRTKAALRVAEQCGVRIIMTGSPIAKNLVDEWSQLKLLDEGIVGHRYLTTFRNEYCIMGGFEGKQIVGSKNLQQFKDRTAPYVFRVKKEDCLDLPPKQYRKASFGMSKEQKQAIEQLRTTQIYTTANGDDVFFDGAAPTLGKIQEVSNGFIAHEFGVDLFPNPRMETLKSLLEDIDGKVVIWARYKHDIRSIAQQLGDEAVTYFGDDGDKARTRAKQRFCDPDDTVRYFVATPATAAEGLDGLQRVSSTAIYYSNGFNSVQRWQSEDRIHRIGMGGSAVYIDLVAKGCIDYSLLRNLQAKKDFSALVLDVGRELGLE